MIRRNADGSITVGIIEEKEKAAETSAAKPEKKKPTKKKKTND